MVPSIAQLQSGLFNSTDENVVSVIELTDYPHGSKRKRELCLALVIRRSVPFHPMLYVVKGGGNQKIKRKQSYSLSKLVSCDAKMRVPNSEFTLTFSTGTEVTFHSYSIVRKSEFLERFWECCQRYLSPLPVLKDFDLPSYPMITNKSGYSPHADLSTSHQVDSSHVEDDNEEVFVEEGNCERQRLREDESLLIEILNKFSKKLHNIDQFAESLYGSLEDMKWGNIEIILMSQGHCKEVVSGLDKCIEHVEKYEKLLDIYDQSLLNLRSQIKELEMVDGDRELRLDNQKKLLEELSRYTSSLDISKEVMNFAKENNYDDIDSTVEALSSYTHNINVHIPAALSAIPSIDEQSRMVSNSSNLFIQNIVSHIRQKIKAYVSDPENGAVPDDIIMTNHYLIHRTLLPYSRIVAIIKLLHAPMYTELTAYYCESFSQLYETKIYGLSKVVMTKIGELSDLNPLTAAVSSRPLTSNNVFIKLNEANVKAIHDFISYIDQFFEMLELALTKEIKFCNIFFSLNVTTSSASSSGNEALLTLQTSNLSSSQQYPSKRGLLVMKGMLGELFGFLDEMMKSFFTTMLKRFPLLFVYVVNKLYLLKQRLTNPKFGYLLALYGSWYESFSDQFDELIKLVFFALEDNRVLKNKRAAAITNGVLVFEDFILDLEIMLPEDVTLRSPYFEEIYKKASVTILIAVDMLTENENQLKLHASKVENLLFLMEFHRKHKVHWYQDEKKLIKGRYEASIKSFIDNCLNDHLKSLITFFNAIENFLRRGVKHSEISIQSSHSVLQLRKVLNSYTFKDVKRTTEFVAKQIYKLFSDENLRLIIWTRTQSTLIALFDNILNLLIQCYPQHTSSWDLNSENLHKILSAIDISVNQQ